MKKDTDGNQGATEVSAAAMGAQRQDPTPDSASLVPSVEEAKDRLLEAIAHISGLSKLTCDVEIYQELNALILAVQSQSAQLQEQCFKCKRFFPRNLVALELRDGAPLDSGPPDYIAQQWCVVCHDQSVVEHYKSELAQSAQRLAEVEQARDALLSRPDPRSASSLMKGNLWML